jgi:hypothetical protein
MVEIQEPNEALGEESLDHLENEIGFCLPREYRTFLGTYNGGYPEPDVFDFSDGREGSSVNQFYGLTIKDNSRNILSVRNTFLNRIPARYLAIACDPGGNQICLAMAGEDEGTIIFWDHELEAEDGEPPSSENMTMIANSFNEFIEKLRNLD